MKKFELFLGTVAGTCMLYKLLWGNELNSFLIISFLGLSLFYIYFSFLYFNGIPLKKAFKKEQYKTVSRWKVFGSIALGFGLGITVLSVLWSLMSWPFNAYYPLGIPVLIGMGMIAFFKYTSTKSISYIRMLKRVIVVGIIGSAFWLNPNGAFTKYQKIPVIKEQEQKTYDLQPV